MATKANAKKKKLAPKTTKSKRDVLLVDKKLANFKASYFTIPQFVKRHQGQIDPFRNKIKLQKLSLPLVFLLTAFFVLGVISGSVFTKTQNANPLTDFQNETKKEYWLELHRKSEKEYLYYGTAGDKKKSEIIKTFTVKTGRPGERPTPLPQALGKNYWKIVKKYSSRENPETAPYFLELDVPVEDGYFGPVPYNECDGQCSWELPGYFGLHGVNGDLTRLGSDNEGSSGCVRHTDEDITYLYNLLEIDDGIRYYIVDV